MVDYAIDIWNILYPNESVPEVCIILLIRRLIAGLPTVSHTLYRFY